MSYGNLITIITWVHLHGPGSFPSTLNVAGWKIVKLINGRVFGSESRSNLSDLTKLVADDDAIYFTASLCAFVFNQLVSML